MKSFSEICFKKAFVVLFETFKHHQKDFQCDNYRGVFNVNTDFKIIRFHPRFHSQIFYKASLAKIGIYILFMDNIIICINIQYYVPY